MNSLKVKYLTLHIIICIRDVPLNLYIVSITVGLCTSQFTYILSSYSHGFPEKEYNMYGSELPK